MGRGPYATCPRASSSRQPPCVGRRRAADRRASLRARRCVDAGVALAPTPAARPGRSEPGAVCGRIWTVRGTRKRLLAASAAARAAAAAALAASWQRRRRCRTRRSRRRREGGGDASDAQEGASEQQDRLGHQPATLPPRADESRTAPARPAPQIGRRGARSRARTNCLADRRGAPIIKWVCCARSGHSECAKTRASTGLTGSLTCAALQIQTRASCLHYVS